MSKCFVRKENTMQYAVKELMFLVEKYNLKFTEQTFESTPFGNWVTKTYSFYNDSGCFTISELLQRDEIDFYFSDVFSTAYPDLKKRQLNVWDNNAILEKHQRWIFGLKNPFFWYSKKKYMKALAEIIQAKISNNKEFFSINV